MRGSKRPRPFIQAVRWGGRPSPRLAAVLLALWSVSAGAGGRPLLPADHHEGADPLAFYAANIAAQVVQAKCVNCHVAGGPATGTPLRFARGSGSAVVEGNFQAFSNYVAADSARIARILSKVQGQLGHGGGLQIAPGSRDLRNLEAFLDLLRQDDQEEAAEPTAAVGYGAPLFLSPHANPIAASGGFVYAVNTPAGTVDVIAADSRRIVDRINVGIDPVSVAVRPDGKEVWVANHVSDTVSVIDVQPGSHSYRQVVATIQDIDPGTVSTRFDEPVGIAFASNEKAYVALSPSNRVAIVDVPTHSVSGHLRITAQDPRAIAVRGNRLYVIPFESNNQSQLSGCVPQKIDDDTCTFDAVEHVFSNNNVLSLNYDADIVKNPLLPDRDLFVFDTRTDQLVEVVDTVGTLLYGLAIDSKGRVFVAQTDARNDANGRAGTKKEGLLEMENRAFLNQITMIDCGDSCSSPVFYDLEPLPPRHPAPGMALATPFGIQVSADDQTLVVTAAGSDKLFTVAADTGAVLGRVDVGAVPRGVAIESNDQGRLERGWVLNAVANSVSVVDLSVRIRPRLLATIEMEDPTHPEVKRGRIAFNDADASSTGTFSCESCHPDGHTDQLIWVLDTPICDIDGCTQIPPRLTMPVRGLRDTQPYHWDGRRHSRRSVRRQQHRLHQQPRRTELRRRPAAQLHAVSDRRLDGDDHVRPDRLPRKRRRQAGTARCRAAGRPGEVPAQRPLSAVPDPALPQCHDAGGEGRFLRVQLREGLRQLPQDALPGQLQHARHRHGRTHLARCLRPLDGHAPGPPERHRSDEHRAHGRQLPGTRHVDPRRRQPQHLGDGAAGQHRLFGRIRPPGDAPAGNRQNAPDQADPRRPDAGGRRRRDSPAGGWRANRRRRRHAACP